MSESIELKMEKYPRHCTYCGKELLISLPRWDAYPGSLYFCEDKNCVNTWREIMENNLK